MSLFSKQNKAAFMEPLHLNNPIMVQVLGICSALAVTSQLKPALVMGLAVTVITAFANVIISIIRNTIPMRIRIIVQLVVVAALVTIVSMVLKAYLYHVSVQLSVYVGLIITNCILMGRLEAFAMSHSPWPSFLDGVGNGIGYALVLIVVGAIGIIYAIYLGVMLAKAENAEKREEAKKRIVNVLIAIAITAVLIFIMYLFSNNIDWFIGLKKDA